MKQTQLSISTGTFVRFWLVILGFAAAIGAIFLARGSLIMIAISFFLALVLNRPVSFIARHLPGKSRVFATLIAYVVIVALIALIFFLVVPIFVKQISVFVAGIPDLLRNFQKDSGWLGDFLNQYHLTNQYDIWVKDIQAELGSAAQIIGGSFVQVISSLAGFLVNLIFIAVLTLLMLVEGPRWEQKFWRLVYRDREKRLQHQKIVAKMYGVVTGYVSAQTTVALISGTFTALLVGILSAVFALDFSLIAPAWVIIFAMTFVPMFGAIIGGALVTLLLLLYSWPAAVIYLILFIVEQQIENNIVAPHIQSKRLNISAMVVLLSVLIGMEVGGFLGILIAIPVAGCIVVVIREILAARKIREKMIAESAGMVNIEEDLAHETVVFTEENRKFVKPNLPRRKTKKSRQIAEK